MGRSIVITSGKGGTGKSMKNARNQVAGAIGVSDNEVIFTSGGTEADNTAVRGAAYAGRRRGKKIITSRIEHPAVLETFKSLAEEGFIPVYIDVDKEGRIDMHQGTQ